MKAIITADWHLRKEPPVCRTETESEWYDLQVRSMEFIRDFSQTQTVEIPILIIGDIFDRSFGSKRMEHAFIDVFCSMKHNVFLLAGNHDLPYHSIDNLKDSSIQTLFTIFTHVRRFGNDVYAYDFGQPIDPYAPILCTHQLVWEGEKPPMADGQTAAELLDGVSSKWIFTGDNHTAFHYQRDGRHVVNPGCLTRQTAAVADYQPIVYVVDTDAGTVEPVALPDNDPARITTRHLDVAEERSSRIEAFLSAIKNTKNVSLSFTDNLKNRLGSVTEPVKKIIVEIGEEV